MAKCFGLYGYVLIVLSGSPAFYTASRLILFLWDRINNKTMYCFCYFFYLSLDHHVPFFEKQLTALYERECQEYLTLSKDFYVYLFINRFLSSSCYPSLTAIEFLCLIYDFKLAVISVTCCIS